MSRKDILRDARRMAATPKALEKYIRRQYMFVAIKLAASHSIE